MEYEIENSKLITKDDYDKQIWVDDFHRKGSILDSKYKQSQPEDLYTALTGSVNNGCMLLIEDLPKRKVRMVDSYNEVTKYTDEYGKVIIFAKDFNKDSSVRMRFMKYLNAFIIDIDEVRTYNIGIALRKIDDCPVKPNFIVNSGNGLHLYYIFAEKFDFLDYTSGMAYIRKVKRVHVKGDKKKQDIIATADKIKGVYSKMIGWFLDPSYIIDTLHLAHGIRMFGGKTKNAQIRSTVYKGYDEMYDLETFAEITGVELFTKEEDEEYDRMFGDKSKLPVMVDKDESEVEAEVAEVVASPPPVVAAPTKRIRLDAEAMSERFIELGKLIKLPRRAAPKWTAYKYLVASIKTLVKIGKRNHSLLIMCCSGRLYQIPKNVVREDLLEMAKYMNERDPDDIITPANIETAFAGYFSNTRYKNETITKYIGIPFGRKQKELRQDGKQNKINDVILMLEIIEREYSANPKISLRDLSDALKLHRIERGRTFLSSDPDVVEIRSKYRV